MSPTGKIRAAMFLTLAFVAGELIAAFFAHSLALFSDAGHNFADAAALGFSWYALAIAAKPSHQGMTFGYHRAGILAALVNAVGLVVIALIIFYEAFADLKSPRHPQGDVMIIAACIAVALNTSISISLHAGAKHDLNLRGAYLHMLGDALSAFGVVIAGLIIILTGSKFADPIVSFLIAILILYSSSDILKQSINVLMEGAPAGMDMPRVETIIKAVPGVLNCHDLHVWTVGPGAIAASVHILVAEQSIRQGQQILKAVVHDLDHHFGINHATVQVEVEGHESNDMYCCIDPQPNTHIGHHH